MAYYWITAEDNKILISKLKDDHLLNIIQMIANYAENGLTRACGGCGVGDNMDIYYDEYTIYGEEVYDFFKKNGSYERLIKEKKKRKLFLKGEKRWQKLKQTPSKTNLLK